MTHSSSNPTKIRSSSGHLHVVMTHLYYLCVFRTIIILSHYQVNIFTAFPSTATIIQQQYLATVALQFICHDFILRILIKHNLYVLFKSDRPADHSICTLIAALYIWQQTSLSGDKWAILDSKNQATVQHLSPHTVRLSHFSAVVGYPQKVGHVCQYYRLSEMPLKLLR